MKTVVIIAGSKSDAMWLAEIFNLIQTDSVEVKTHFASAHREPKVVLELLELYNAMPSVLFVTIAGRSNALSGMVAANTQHPVIACPPLKTEEEYMVDIHSSLRMPSGVPVLTILGTKNCAMAVNRIMGL